MSLFGAWWQRRRQDPENGASLLETVSDNTAPTEYCSLTSPSIHYVPDGRSFWEIGTGIKAGAKATTDYSDLTAVTPEQVRRESTFVFVTPLSGRRGWEHSWEEDAQASWLEKRRTDSEWRDVRVIDGTKLIDWLNQFPSVALWLAQRAFGLPAEQIETVEQRWALVRSYGEPPALIPRVFLANRDDARTRLAEVLSDTIVQLKLETHYPDQIVDFVCAHVEDLDEESRVDAEGRCLVISGVEGWNAMVRQREKHVLIAENPLDLSGTQGTRLIQQARRAGHAVVFGAAAGGIPDLSGVSLRAPRIHQLEEALIGAGYGDERARTLAQKSGGNLGSLLRCLQNLSLLPDWADSSAASELAIAAALGEWTETSPDDLIVIEGVVGNVYGGWIAKVREVALRPGTPLSHSDGAWKFLARYEAWYALGPRIYDRDIERLQAAAIAVLKEVDPQFELPTKDRYAASIHGKVLRHSQHIRNGLADFLALLGSHPEALTSTSLGSAVTSATLAVREILSNADWMLWASLSHQLPLLAEAAPSEFLCAVEAAISGEQSPFDNLFSQEGDGFFGGSYISGVLWAIETIAWDPQMLVRAALCLAELAAHDPGGKFSNRPANSLTTIFLPWLPQTCASIDTRTAAVRAVLEEVPSVGWKFLLSLLPDARSSSSGSRRPAWREIIPNDWSPGVTNGEYWAQVVAYSELAISAAKNSSEKLTDLIHSADALPDPVLNQLLVCLSSAQFKSLTEEERLPVWTALTDLVAKHKKFFDAEWAMPPEKLRRIEEVTQELSPKTPNLLFQRLFSDRDWDLVEERGNYKEQSDLLERKRISAIHEILKTGIDAVIEFSRSTQSPWRVGISLGSLPSGDVDSHLLPNLLQAEEMPLRQLIGGFVWGRFLSFGWAWVDATDMSEWNSEQIGQFLAYLPFTSSTWVKAEALLGSNESSYWLKTSANPFESDQILNTAIEKLIECGRPYAAVHCLYRLVNDKAEISPAIAVRALRDAVTSSEAVRATDGYELIEIIKALQNDPRTPAQDLFDIEWAYLPVLNKRRDASPKLLETRLATDPQFFCEVVRLVFRSTKPDWVSPAVDKDIATNAYRLLSEWTIPPGSHDGQDFDPGQFSAWLDAVKVASTDSGHLEVALSMVGHVLTHVPVDPSGFWINRSVATALNAKDSDAMRRGYQTEIYNSRGAHWVDPTAQPELDLAEGYRKKADSAEREGYSRLATTLRDLATSYEREAQKIQARTENQT